MLKKFKRLRNYKFKYNNIRTLHDIDKIDRMFYKVDIHLKLDQHNDVYLGKGQKSGLIHISKNAVCANPAFHA